jgi:hypothetical protein
VTEQRPGQRAQRAGAAAPTSLVYYHQTVADDEGSSCPDPRLGVRLFNLDTGEVKPVPCGRLACPPCARYLAWRRSMAMAYARPERRFELTQVGDDWQTVRARVKDFRYRIVEAGYVWDHSWMGEPNPRGTGHHVHGYQRGSYVPQDTISQVADRCGMGRVTYVKAMRGQQATGYGLKALTYGLKGATRAESHALHLELNGGRLSHHSRNFYGMPVREAERQAVASRREGPASWVVTTVAELDRSLPRRRSQ